MFKRPESSYPRTSRSLVPGWLIAAGLAVAFAFAFWCSLHTWGELVLTATILIVGLPAALYYGARSKDT